MNRETKRMMQRQGQIEADGTPAAGRRQAPTPRRPAAQQKKAPVLSRILEFFREVRSELRQVAWPTRPEVMNSAGVVLITLVLMVGLIFVLNYLFSHGVTLLFKT